VHNVLGHFDMQQPAVTATRLRVLYLVWSVLLKSPSHPPLGLLDRSHRNSPFLGPQSPDFPQCNHDCNVRQCGQRSGAHKVAAATGNGRVGPSRYPLPVSRRSLART
jgi:hypothetical protein